MKAVRRQAVILIMQSDKAPLRLVRPVRLLTSLSGRYLIASAAILHILTVICIFLAARLGIFHDARDANGFICSFATDSCGYQSEINFLLDTLTQQGIGAWLRAPSFLHLKVYSLSIAALRPLFGFTVLSVEPLNILYYLVILFLVFKLGEEIFDRRAGLLAAGIVALWPSFLMHTVQLFREPLFIALVLALILIVSSWLTRTYLWRRGLAVGAAACAVITLLELTRNTFRIIVLAIVMLGICLLLLRQLCERHILAGNLLSAAPALVMMIALFAQGDVNFEKPGIAQVGFSTTQSSAQSAIAGHSAMLAASIEESPFFWRRFRERADLTAARIGRLRCRFVTDYPNSSSTIDENACFDNAAAIVRYLPRAIAIGLFAPFPEMWFARGNEVGAAGRLVSGLETLAMYIVELLALVTAWHERRSLSVWLLLLTALVGLTVLGLVVANVGALYRLRYAFWILLIIPGARTAQRVLLALTKRASNAEAASATGNI